MHHLRLRCSITFVYKFTGKERDSETGGWPRQRSQEEMAVAHSSPSFGLEWGFSVSALRQIFVLFS